MEEKMHQWESNEDLACTKVVFEYFVIDKKDFAVWIDVLVKRISKQFDGKLSEFSIFRKIQNTKYLLDKYNIKNTITVKGLEHYSYHNNLAFQYYALRYDVFNKDRPVGRFKDICFFEKFEPFWDDLLLDVIKQGKINYEIISKYTADDNYKRMILDTFIAFGYVDNSKENKCFITEEYYEDILRDRERVDKKIITYDDVKKAIKNIE